MAYLLRLFFVRNVDQILAKFHRIIDELNGAETKHKKKADEYDAEADRLRNQAAYAKAESDRARQVKEKLRALVG